MKIGNTSFVKDCAKGLTFDKFKEVYKNCRFKNDDGVSISHEQMFKHMGGTFKGIDTKKKQTTEGAE